MANLGLWASRNKSGRPPCGGRAAGCPPATLYFSLGMGARGELGSGGCPALGAGLATDTAHAPQPGPSQPAAWAWCVSVGAGWEPGGRGRPLHRADFVRPLCSQGLALTKSHLCPGTCPRLLAQPTPTPGGTASALCPSPGSPLPRAVDPCSLLGCLLLPASSGPRPPPAPVPPPSWQRGGQWPAGPPFQRHVPDPVLGGWSPENPWARVHASWPGAPPCSPLSCTAS